MNTRVLINPLTIDRHNEVMALWRQCEGIGPRDDRQVTYITLIGQGFVHRVCGLELDEVHVVVLDGRPNPAYALSA